MHIASRLSIFLAELKRRKVARVAVVYVIVGLLGFSLFNARGPTES